MTQNSFPFGVSGAAGAHNDIAFQTVRQRIDAAMATLLVARGLASNSRQIDLTGLDSDIGRLCAAALDLEPEQGRIIRQQLHRLLDELDALAEAVAPPSP